MPSESQDQLNSEISQALLEILSHSEEKMQLEIAQIIQQIHRINHLIYCQQNSWLSVRFKFSQKEQELIGWLAEIKGTLLMLKSEQPSLSMIQTLRINLEHNINNYQYKIGGWILNSFSYLVRSKSTPLKIVTGLLFTTVVSMIILKISIVHLHRYDSAAPTSHELASPLTPTQTNKADSVVIDKKPKLVQQTKPNTSISHSNESIFHGLLYAASAGALGSITSLLFRIIKFNNESYDDPLIPFFIGIFKPVIGLILGIFVYSLITSETLIITDFISSVPISNTVESTPNARKHSFIFSLAFLIGFSERLASDLLKKTTAELEPPVNNTKDS